MRIQLVEMQQQHQNDVRSTCHLQSELSDKSDAITKLRESILLEASRHEQRIFRLEETLQTAQSEESTLAAKMKSKTIELKHLQDHLSETIGLLLEIYFFVSFLLIP